MANTAPIIHSDLLKRNENIHPQKDLYANIHSSVIYGSQMPGNNPNVHQSIGEWIRKMWHIHTIGCHVTVQRNKVLIYAAICINLKHILLSETHFAGQKNPHIV